jgi:hypothetical protein
MVPSPGELTVKRGVFGFPAQVSNAGARSVGGEVRAPSTSIFVIEEDLTLTLTDVVDAIPGCWAESVSGCENRACVLGCLCPGCDKNRVH